MTGLVQVLIGKKSFLVRFQDGCEKDVNSNKLTIVTVDRIMVTEEAKVAIISVIPDKANCFEKGYYHCVHVLLQFNKEYSVNRKEYQADMEEDMYEEEM